MGQSGSETDELRSPLVDRWGRVHRALRVSVTDRCNIRCFYCMPNEAIAFKPRRELLTFEEIVRVVSVAANMGVEKVRLTGGEPLLRQELPRLVAMLKQVPGVREVALTTNGLLLDQLATPLKQAGLDRLNISLDTLSEETFQQISRRKGVDRVLQGIEAARQAGFERIRLNAVAIAGLIESDAVSLVEFAHARDLEMRFIEFMPLDGELRWSTDQVVTGQLLRQLIQRELGNLIPKERVDPAQPADDWVVEETGGVIGFIEPVSQPFCSACDRLRMTAEGKLRNCLFSTVEWDLQQVLRGKEPEACQQTLDAKIARLIRECVWEKHPAHGIATESFERPERAMYQIGG